MGAKTILYLFTGYLFIFLISCQTSHQEGESSVDGVDSLFLQAIQIGKVPFTKDPAGFARGVHYVDSAYARVKSPGIAEKSYRYDLLATIHYRMNLYNESILYCDSIIKLIESAGELSKYPVHYANAYFTKGDDYIRMGAFVEAYECYFNARKRIEPYLDDCSKSDYSYRIGMVLYNQGNYRQAMRYFSTCIDQTNACRSNFKFIYRRQELLSNIGLCYIKMLEADSALYYFNLALGVIREIKPLSPDGYSSQVAEGVVFGNMAKAYVLKGDYVQAEFYLNKSAAQNMWPERDTRDAQLAMLELSNIYMVQGKLTKAEEVLQKIEQSLDTLPNTKIREELFRLKWLCSDKAGNEGKAYKYLRAYQFTKDSTELGNRRANETDIQQYLAALENQEENKQLRSENRKNQTRLLLASVFVVMLVLIIVPGIINHRRSKRNIHLLTELNSTISKQKLELESTLQQLELRNRDREHIMRIVAHDLRNPVSGIFSLTSMMLEEMPAAESVYENMAVINKSSAATLALINELLDSVSYSKEDQIAKTEENIYELISSSVKLLEFIAAEKKQQLVWHPPSTGLNISINREKIWRVLNNIIANAIKFSEEGKQIEVKTNVTGKELIISVHDYGVGIPDILKDRIFDTFTTAKREGTSGEKAYGLGMSISKRIVEAHGGKITFESKAGEGTTFFIHLPV